MSKYDELVAELKGQGTNFSKGALSTLAMGMFNDTEHTFKTYIKKGDSYEVKDVSPAKQMREQLIAPILRQYGVDKAELNSLDSVQIGKSGGEALADFALLLTKQYISPTTGLGRKLTLPMLSASESVQSLAMVVAAEEKKATTSICRNEDGTYSTKPTGMIATTARHERLKAGNRVPAWLKKSTPDPAAKA